MRFDSWGDFPNIRYRRIPADDRGPAPDLQDFRSATRSTAHKHLNRVRVWWSDVLRHPLHLIKQLILLRKDSGLWFTQRVMDITWSLRQQRPSQPTQVSAYVEVWRTPPATFTVWHSCSFLYSLVCTNIFLKMFKQMTQIRVGADSFETLHHQHLRHLIFNSVTVCMCVFSSRIWPWGFVCDGSGLSHKSKPAFSSLIFTSTADYRIKDKVYIWWQEQSAILLQK